jgi:hypothetical protein
LGAVKLHIVISSECQQLPSRAPTMPA